MNLVQGCSLLRITFGLVLLATVGVCGGGGGSPSAPATFTIGGTVSGLTGTLVLQNNGGSNISVTTSGAFTFTSAINSGSTYAVTILTQPAGQTCSVTAVSGTANANVSNVVVTCKTNVYTVGGTIAGLGDETGLVLLNNGIDATIIPGGSSTFSMNTALASGSAYAITIQHHPPATHCVISSGSGGVGASNVSNIGVSCGATVETVIHSFIPSEGTSPWGSLLLASDGNFYGMPTNYGSLGFGAVIKVTRTGELSVLYSFAGGTADGAHPYGNLIEASDGNFYGMNSAGGASNKGVVIRITLGGIGTILHSFAGGAADGDTPLGSLIQGSDGNLYGMTSIGGTANLGTVFKIDLAGTETVLYSFGVSPNDGVIPAYGTLVEGTDGKFYGTAGQGGALANGTIFSITAAGIETVLYSFGIATGANPESSLVLANDGSFWGTTINGGAAGNGTVFKVTSTGALTLMHSFMGPPADGTYGQGPLIQASDGNFYGITYLGGASNSGAVYRITSAGIESLLYSFSGLADGAWASGGLTEDGNGDLYGMTSAGGNNSGTLFKLY